MTIPACGNCYKGKTCLSYAVEFGKIKMVEKLLSYDCDPNEKDIFGITPLMRAYERFNQEIIDLLLLNGADPTIKDKDGKEAHEHDSPYYRIFRPNPYG